MKKVKVNKQTTLRDFLSHHLKISKKKAKQLIDTKLVLVNNKRVWIASHMLKVGDVIEIPLIENSPKWDIKNHLLYEDEYIIAINKPPFVESEGSKNSLEDKLKGLKKSRKIQAIHRLDRDTSGVILFAKNRAVFEKFKQLWQEKKVKKEYLAISHGEAVFRKKVVNIPVEKKYAKSIIQTLKTGSGFSLFKIEIPTGRKHQIRIHLSKIRHPIVGDKTYGLKDISDPLLKNIKRQMLHSYRISFFHPYLKKKITITGKPLSDFENFGKIIRLL